LGSLGRTGRAGRDGIAITYFTDEDAPFLKSCVVFCSSGLGVIEETDLNRIANVIMQSGQSVPDWMVKLPKPGKKKKKDMGKAQRAKASVGLKGENVGRAQALKKKYVVSFVFPLLKVVAESPCVTGKWLQRLNVERTWFKRITALRVMALNLSN